MQYCICKSGRFHNGHLAWWQGPFSEPGGYCFGIKKLDVKFSHVFVCISVHEALVSDHPVLPCVPSSELSRKRPALVMTTSWNLHSHFLRSTFRVIVSLCPSRTIQIETTGDGLGTRAHKGVPPRRNISFSFLISPVIRVVICIFSSAFRLTDPKKIEAARIIFYLL